MRRLILFLLFLTFILSANYGLCWDCYSKNDSIPLQSYNVWKKYCPQCVQICFMPDEIRACKYYFEDPQKLCRIFVAPGAKFLYQNLREWLERQVMKCIYCEYKKIIYEIDILKKADCNL